MERERLMPRVFENGEDVGYIVHRAMGWYEFVAVRSYWATGIAGEMMESSHVSLEVLIAKLEAAGLEVRKG